MKKIVLIIFTLIIYNLGFSQVIVYPDPGSDSENFAAKELRRYIFLRTGTAPSLATANSYSSLPSGDVIVVAANNQAIITELKANYGNIDAPSSDNRLGYIIKSFSKDSRNVLVITGADSSSTLRAAYRFAELIGCHFNLSGDVIPDKKLTYPLDISSYDEKAQPRFEMRGIEPFHNFLAGPDFWSTGDYRSVISQQAKMGMNLFGLHLYPPAGMGDELEGPEPHVWIGHKNDVNADGTIKEDAAYTSYWATTYRPDDKSSPSTDHQWGDTPFKTTEFSNGADKLFAYDEMASDAMGFKNPTTNAEKAAVLNNVGFLLKDAFTHAKKMGVKTVLGHEVPLGYEPGNPTQVTVEGELEWQHLIHQDRYRAVPPEVLTRMQTTHGLTLPTDTGATNETFVKTLLEGIFTRIERMHPLDYYWIWTYETWAYNGNSPDRKQIECVAQNYKYAHEVMQQMNVPFKMATFGWKVGSEGGDGNALEFHDDLPLDVPFGGLWDNAGSMQEVLPTGRPGWSSCWYEEDWGLVQTQLRVMSIYNEVGHALNNGGVQAHVAKHWRLNSVAPASAAHAQLSWGNKGLVSETLPTTAQDFSSFSLFDIFDTPVGSQPSGFTNWINQFYRDWAKANFGPEKSNEIGDLLAMADRLGEPHKTGEGLKGSIPKSAKFLPSRLYEIDDGDPTSTTDSKFLDAIYVYTQFCSYKDQIVGTGNIDRYMYWYHFFKGQIEMNKMVIYNDLYMKDKSDANRDSVLSAFSKLMTHEIQRVRGTSELGIIAQLQQSTNKFTIQNPEELGITAPLSTSYEGGKSVRAMPEVTQIYGGENFEQKVIFIGNGAIANPTMYYREIGSTGSFTSVALTSINSSTNVLKATLADPGYDFEYYITGSIGGETVTYPVTGGNGASNINKTVVIKGAKTNETKFTLTTSADHGSISPDGGSYSDGTSVTLTATADLGYGFSHWSGDVTGTENPITIIMDANKTVTANFVTVSTYTLTTNATNGSISPASGTYNENSVVTLTASADLGYTFSHWSGDLTGTSNPTSITMDGNKTVTANFTAAPTYTLTTNATNGSISPASGTFNENEVVTLTATADDGYVFSSWSGDLTGTTNPATLTMNDNKTVTANFDVLNFNVTLSPNSDGSISIDPPGGVYPYGTDITVTATPNPGYTFIDWTGDLNGSINPSQITVNKDMTIGANFNNLTSIPTESVNKKIRVYPNPSTGKFKVDLGNSFKLIKVNITDLLGKVVQQSTYNNTQYFDTTIEGPTGFYLLIIESNEYRSVIPLVKQ